MCKMKLEKDRKGFLPDPIGFQYGHVQLHEICHSLLGLMEKNKLLGEIM